MKKDPRIKNKTFRTDSISDYISDYSDELHQAIQSVEVDQMNLAFETLTKFYSNQNITYITSLYNNPNVHPST